MSGESLPIYTINNFVNQMGNGKTQPFLASTSNGSYVVKYKENDDGPKALINEYVCYNLAKLLGLPIPEAALLKIDSDVIDNDINLQQIGIRPGLHFGSQLIIKAQPSLQEPLVGKAKNQEDIPSIFLFDHIIYNDDRAINPGNFLMDLREKMILIIDHTHPFKNGVLWNEIELEKINSEPLCLLKNFRKKNYKVLLPYIYGNNPFHKINSYIESITKEDIINCFSGLPNEWGLSERSRIALIEFIWYRIQQKDEFIRLIKEGSFF